MKYELGDTVEFGNPGWRKEAVVIEANPPQPTYAIRTEEGQVFSFDENQLELIKKRPVPCGHKYNAYVITPTSQGNREGVMVFDFCPLCGERLTTPPA